MSKFWRVKCETRDGKFYHLEGTEGKGWIVRNPCRSREMYELFYVGKIYAKGRGFRLKDFRNKEVAFLDHDQKTHVIGRIIAIYERKKGFDDAMLDRDDILVSVGGDLRKGPIREPIKGDFHLYVRIWQKRRWLFW